MSTRTTTKVAAALVAAGLSAAVAAPAHAATWRAPDARGDVVSQSASADDPAAFVPAPGQRGGDVTSLRVTHDDERVVVVLGHDRLNRPRGTTQVVHVVRLRAGGKDRDVALVTSRAHPQGQLAESPCRAVRTHVDYRSDRVRVTVPTRCLGSPRAVRAGAATGSLIGDRLYADEALRDGGVGDEPALGPRVRR